MEPPAEGAETPDLVSIEGLAHVARAARLSTPPEAAGAFPCHRRKNAETKNDPHWTLRDDECPLKDRVAFDHTTGEIAWYPSCKNARCRRCTYQVSARTFALAAKALEDVDRSRFVTLTQVAEGWQNARLEIYELAKQLRRNGYTTEWLWVLERGEKNGMKHAHLVQHGDYVPWQDLLRMWGRRVEIQASRNAAEGYLAKNVLMYVAKGVGSGKGGDGVEAHMRLNGGRAAHWSRGFFGGMGRDDFARQNPMPGKYFVRTAPLEKS